MKDKLYKFASYTKHKGIHHALKKTALYVKKSAPTIKQKIDVMVDIEDVVAADFIARPYKVPAKKKKNTLKIGWILSPISAGSGGQNTITRFARFLQEHGHDITIYIYEGIQPQAVAAAKKILKESFNFNVKVKLINDYEESDAIIATGWETAYPAFNLKTMAHKFYFVQDFEPYFYGLGSKAVLAENTYKFGFYGITAGRWLSHRVSEKYGMLADYFDFGVDLEIYKSDHPLPKKKKICFYARPVTERRAFELGVIALEVFHKKYPEYEIEFFGWDTSGYDIPFPYTNRGILNHHELAVLYQESVACLVLSLTNVSLLPFELLASGCIPVMNSGKNNSMVLGKNDYIEYTGASPIELASGLEKICRVKDTQAVAMQASRSVNDKPWDQSYEKVEKIIIREVTGR